jgi:hypothetical protein
MNSIQKEDSRHCHLVTIIFQLCFLLNNPLPDVPRRCNGRDSEDKTNFGIFPSQMVNVHFDKFSINVHANESIEFGVLF